MATQPAPHIDPPQTPLYNLPPALPSPTKAHLNADVPLGSGLAASADVSVPLFKRAATYSPCCLATCAVAGSARRPLSIACRSSLNCSLVRRVSSSTVLLVWFWFWFWLGLWVWVWLWIEFEFGWRGGFGLGWGCGCGCGWVAVVVSFQKGIRSSNSQKHAA